MNLNLEFTDPIQWNQDDEYSINDVVFNGTDAYTAIDYVPSGTLLTNTAYWKKTGKFIRTQNLDNGAVTTEKIATNAVTTGKLAGKVVTTAKIDDAAVTADKLSDDALDDAIAMSGQGENVATDNSSYLASLTVDGKAVQDGTPTPEAPVDVQVVQGINLFEESTLIANANGGINTSGTSAVARIESGNTYTVSFKRNQNGQLGLYITPDGGLSPTRITYMTDNTSVYSFTASSTGIMHIYASSGEFTASSVIVTEFQVELGSTATPYIPYGSIGLKVGSTITPIDLNGNVLASLPDGTKDVLTVDSVGHVVLEKRTNLITLPSENWNLTNGLFGRNVFTDIYSASGTVAVDVLCSAFVSGSPNVDLHIRAYSTKWCDIRYNAITSALDFNTWLANNPVHVLYPCTSTTIDLGYIDMPAIPDGSAISITAQVTPTISASWWTRGAAAVPEALDDLDDSVISKLEPRIDDIASSIAVVENGETSSANYSVNDFIMRFDKLYQVTSAIATGESFVVDTNIEEKTVIEAIIAMIENM